MIGFTIYVAANGNPAVIGSASGFQFYTPWGSSDSATVWEEAHNQAFTIGSIDSGRQGMFFNLGLQNFSGTPTLPTVALTNSTFTNGSANVTVSSTAGIYPGFLVFCSVAGLVGLACVNSITSGTVLVINQNFGGTTGSTYTATFVPFTPTNVTSIRATS